MKCSVSAHWACLAKTQRDEIVRAARAKADAETNDGDEPTIRFCDLEPDESTEFICGSCVKGGACLCCKKIALEPEVVDIKDTNDGVVNEKPKELLRENLFRCFTCKRLAHYSCLSVKDNEELDPVDVAITFQEENDWQCADCASYRYQIDSIIAWRPSPPDAIDSYANSELVPNIKEHLPREYLVKWIGRSYRRTEWVPHMWLTTTHASRLKNFYTSGPKIELLSIPSDEGQDVRDMTEKMVDVPLLSAEGSRASSIFVETKSHNGPPKATPDAESRIPPLWKTVDRILDVVLWRSRENRSSRKKQKSKEGDDEDARGSSLSPEVAEALWEAYELGTEPPPDLTETVEEFEESVGRAIAFEDIGRVAWAFIKWDDLSYDEG